MSVYNKIYKKLHAIFQPSLLSGNFSGNSYILLWRGCFNNLPFILLLHLHLYSLGKDGIFTDVLFSIFALVDIHLLSWRGDRFLNRSNFFRAVSLHSYYSRLFHHLLEVPLELTVSLENSMSSFQEPLMSCMLQGTLHFQTL